MSASPERIPLRLVLQSLRQYKDFSYRCETDTVSTETTGNYCKWPNGGRMSRIWLYCHCNCIQVAVAWKRCRCVSSCLPRNPDTDLETATVWCADKFLSFMELLNRSDWVMPGDHRDCGVKHGPTMGRSSFHHQRPTQVLPAQPHHSMDLELILSPFVSCSQNSRSVFYVPCGLNRMHRPKENLQDAIPKQRWLSGYSQNISYSIWSWLHQMFPRGSCKSDQLKS